MSPTPGVLIMQCSKHCWQNSLVILSSKLGFPAQYACHPSAMRPQGGGGGQGRTASSYLGGDCLIPTGVILMLTQPVHSLLRACIHS